MRVGLDLIYLVPGETGGRETYARELVPAMLERSSELELVTFVNRDAGPRLAAELGEEIRAVTLPISARSRGEWAIGELALVSVAARRARVQLLHSMANFAPAWGPFRRVVTVHDMQYKALPELLSWPMRTGTSLLMLAARRADRVIAVSASGRDEIVADLGIEPQRIDIVPNGVRPSPPAAPAADAQAARKQLGLGHRRVALAVASNLPHKNLASLIDALALMPADARPVAIFAGHGTDGGELTHRAAAAGVGEDVRALGVRSSEELETLYALADCLVLTTLHEGFGLPVLEAMARSLPVACSDIPALREVAGEAALYFNPHSSAQIAGAIERLLRDPSLAAGMRQLGFVRAGEFSWSAAADGTLASYERALRGSRVPSPVPARGR